MRLDSSSYHRKQRSTPPIIHFTSKLALVGNEIGTRAELSCSCEIGARGDREGSLCGSKTQDPEEEWMDDGPYDMMEPHGKMR